MRSLAKVMIACAVAGCGLPGRSGAPPPAVNVADADLAPDPSDLTEVSAPPDAQPALNADASGVPADLSLDVSDLMDLKGLADAKPSPDADGSGADAGEAPKDAGPFVFDVPPADIDYAPLAVSTLPTAAWVDVTADYGFQEPNATVHYAWCTVGADLDGDDRDDLLVVRSSGGALAIDVALMKEAGPVHVLSPVFGANATTGGCAAADVDDDGLLDVLVSRATGFFYLHNDGNGLFSDKSDAVLPPILDFFGNAAASADFDGDGQNEIVAGAGDFLAMCGDLPCAYSGADFVCEWSKVIPNDDATQDRMWSKKAGAWQDVTNAWALAPGGMFTVVAAVDIDQDGKMDALFGNEASGHYLLRNTGAGLQKLDTGIGFLPFGRTMGWGVGDLDGDGDLDIMMADAGPMPLYMQQPATADIPVLFHESANKWNLAQTTHDVSSWNPLIVDFDQDMWLDAYIGVAAIAPNGGMVPLVECGPAPKGPVLDLWLRNKDGKQFEPFVAPAAAGDHDLFAVAQTAVDIDQDGDMDVLQVRRKGVLRILRNDLAKPGTSVVVRLKGKSGNTAAIGARLVAEVAGHKLVRQMIGTSGFGGMGMWSAHFGLGGATKIDKLTIHWPGGKTSVLASIPAGGKLVVAAP